MYVKQDDSKNHVVHRVLESVRRLPQNDSTQSFDPQVRKSPLGGSRGSRAPYPN